MLKKLDHPMLWCTLLGCLLAGFGIAAFDPEQHVNYASAISASHQTENAAEWEPEYFDSSVIFFALLLVLAGNVQESFFFWRLRVIRRQDMRNARKVADVAREVANERRALLAELGSYQLEPGLLQLITESCASLHVKRERHSPRQRTNPFSLTQLRQLPRL